MLRFILFCLTLTATCSCGKPNEDVNNKMEAVSSTPTQEASPKPEDKSMKDAKMDVDLMGAMMECNDTFRTEMAFIESLNTTGSFPDETDRTPKCYLRCVLENIAVLSPEGMFDTERVAAIFAGKRNGRPMEGIKEMADGCAADRQETCKCAKSYNFLKCLFTAEIETYEKP